MSKEEAIKILTSKQSELGRLPKKADFDPVSVPRIKRALGPWPRALETAGLKPGSPTHKAKKEKCPKKSNRRNNRRQYR